MVYLLCIIVAIASSFTGSLIGLGGGVILIPSLLFLSYYIDAFAWATPQAMVGISLVTMVFTALSSTIAYAKMKRVDYKTGYLFLIGSIPAGMFGAWLNQFIDADKFSLYFGLLTIGLSLLFLIKRKPRELDPIDTHVHTFRANGQDFYYKVPPFQAIGISVVVGILSGMFGIGGGSIMVPAMVILFGIPVHIAAATSMFMIFFASLLSAGTHIALGHVVWQYILFFIIGAWIGGTLGAKVNQLINGKTLEWILRIILVVVGIRLIIDGMT